MPVRCAVVESWATLRKTDLVLVLLLLPPVEVVEVMTRSHPSASFRSFHGCTRTPQRLMCMSARPHDSPIPPH
jgi:hypothetical protein